LPTLSRTPSLTHDNITGGGVTGSVLDRSEMNSIPDSLLGRFKHARCFCYCQSSFAFASKHSLLYLRSFLTFALGAIPVLTTHDDDDADEAVQKLHGGNGWVKYNITSARNKKKLDIDDDVHFSKGISIMAGPQTERVTPLHMSDAQKRAERKNLEKRKGWKVIGARAPSLLASTLTPRGTAEFKPLPGRGGPAARKLTFQEREVARLEAERLAREAHLELQITLGNRDASTRWFLNNMPTAISHRVYPGRLNNARFWQSLLALPLLPNTHLLTFLFAFHYICAFLTRHNVRRAQRHVRGLLQAAYAGRVDAGEKFGAVDDDDGRGVEKSVDDDDDARPDSYSAHGRIRRRYQ
jgi:hypothetical protein